MRERDLRQILEELEIDVIAKNRKGWLLCSCPFAPFLHDKSIDRNPSFNVHISDNGLSGFNCFTCGASGRITRLIARLAHYRDADYSRLETKAQIAEIPTDFEDFEIEPEEEITRVLDAQLYMAMYPLAWEEKDSREFLKSRNIDQETAQVLQLLYDPEGCRVLFPVFDYKRDLLGFSGRSVIPDERRKKTTPKVKDYGGLRKEKVILGEHLIQQDGPLLVVEGLFAFASMVARGSREFCNPVATLGSHMSESQRDILVSYDRPVVMLYDDDAAGDQGLFGNEAGKPGAVELLKPHVPVAAGIYPKRTGDPDDLTLEEIRRIVTVTPKWQ